MQKAAQIIGGTPRARLRFLEASLNTKYADAMAGIPYHRSIGSHEKKILEAESLIIFYRLT
jgi:hypothetical protein